MTTTTTTAGTVAAGPRKNLQRRKTKDRKKKKKKQQQQKKKNKKKQKTMKETAKIDTTVLRQHQGVVGRQDSNSIGSSLNSLGGSKKSPQHFGCGASSSCWKTVGGKKHFCLSEFGHYHFHSIITYVDLKRNSNQNRALVTDSDGLCNR